LILAHVLHDWSAGPSGDLRAIGDHDNREIASAFVPLTNRSRDFIYVERAFRNQDRICPTRDAAVESDPACVASHNLNHHDSVMSFGSGMNAVDGFANNIACGIETECVVSSP